MGLFYDTIINNVATSLATYNLGSWQFFFDEAANELSSLVTYCTHGPKKVSLLKNNYPYINRSVNRISSSKGFSFYGEDGEIDRPITKPILVDPSSERGNNINDRFNPKVDSVNVFSKDVASDKTKHAVYDEKTVLPTYHEDYSGNPYSEYEEIENVSDLSSLLMKTNRWFKNVKDDYISKRFKTIHAGFFTSSPDDGFVGASAIDTEYGMSHGRNLKKAEKSYDNGYLNPYCRVWTWHHQYKNVVKDTIRPFVDDDGSSATMEYLDDMKGWSKLRSISSSGFESGGKRLSKYGTMFGADGKTNGFVSITPDNEAKNPTDMLRHCMFSIENLAWKGMFCDYGDSDEENVLSPEQKGPLGGRIMWFPPYGLKFNENSNADWQQQTFIGRGEPMYTYSNTTRTGTLQFKMLIDHPSVLDYWERENTSNSKPAGEIDSNEQKMLRFFAGCEILELKKEEEEPKKEDKPKVEKKVEGTDVKDKTISFMVFYPNNYSGMDDKINGNVDPIQYLLNGIGAQKKYVSDSRNDIQDIDTDITKTIKWNGSVVGGYEMRDSSVSLVSEFTDTNAITTVSNGGEDIILMKMYGSKYVSKKIKCPTGEKAAEEWHKRRYYYRADKNTFNQTLLGGSDSYIDKKSYKLNSTGYMDAVNHFKVSGDTCSLTEFFVAVNGDESGILNGLYDSNKVSVIKDILAGKKGKITEIVCDGMASKASNSAKSDSNQLSLAKNRAKTIKEWIDKNVKGIDVKATIGKYEKSPEGKKKKDDVNDKIDKMSRMALVIIHYGGSETEDASKTQASESDTKTVTKQTKGSTEEPDSGKTVALKKKHYRYDEEAKFFDKLKENDPFIVKQLSERVKYFNPCFHSMSPEGFNARLTFLNQCMRQGPTISSSDTNNGNANNLSFGRPPVCVLRIGDFYNTKILIDSLQITYDPLVWDMNQEGIGMMPMIADISLNFKFIGGSDLGGPIQRLQNAISFNYYANTSVYDNRAENIEYEDGGLGAVKNFKAYEGNKTN